jgi:hypothetical protein
VQRRSRRALGRTLGRARKALGVRTAKDGFGGGWLLSLPDEDCQVIAANPGCLRALSERIQRPFFGNVGLSCAYCKKQALVT